MYADMEARDYEGFINKSFYQQKIESLDEPLYDGCGNEAWSVRFGDESEKNENGYPIHEEYYATLLDKNTLLLQQYFTIDGGPGVSYQTFKRVFPGEDVEYVDSQILQEQWSQGNTSIWELESYIDENGNELPLPSSVADLSIELSGEISWSDPKRSIDFEYLGVWGYGRGGSVLITSEDGYRAWFAGAVAREYDKEHDGNASLKMHLYHDGGWLCLREVHEPEVPILNVMKTTLSREEYENNALVKTIRKLVGANGGRYIGTTTEIIEASKMLQGCRIYDNAQKCGLNIKKIIPLLEQYDAIEHFTAPNGNASSRHEFKKIFV
jgi:hypothetical protein